MRNVLASVALATWLIPQAPQPPALRPLDPQVREDGTVTFSLVAPQAKQVAVYVDTMAPAAAVPLVRDERGVWSGRLGPLEADIYTYAFLVDGASINAGLVEIVGRTPEVWHPRKVPHGTVHVQWYDSKSLGMLRSVYVYTPPGYEGSSATYPVLYLLHGGGNRYDTWVSADAALIFDNLLARKSMVPMVVVMQIGRAHV